MKIITIMSGSDEDFRELAIDTLLDQRIKTDEQHKIQSIDRLLKMMVEDKDYVEFIKDIPIISNQESIDLLLDSRNETTCEWVKRGIDDTLKFLVENPSVVMVKEF